MNRNVAGSRLAAFLLLWFVGGLFAGGVEAAETQPAVTLQADSGLVRWIPAAAFAGSTLVLADPTGAVRSFRFRSGEVLAVSLFDAQGAPLPDGTYTWELRLAMSTGLDFHGAAAPRVTSGYFTLAGGSLLDPDRSEAPETRPRRAAAPGLAVAPDQMVPDDLIVDGKGCIGLGCTNNESFLNETLRLKQSVVRLRFEDTSGAGFAGTDWQLAANDVGSLGSGATNRFLLEDLTAGTTPLTVLGGAPSSSLYVNAAGNVGLGTAVPATRLHVLTSGSDSALRLQNTNASGLAGVHFVDNNGVADSFFGIRNAAPSETWLLSTSRPFVFLMGGYERMRVSGIGFVGIGCKDPGSKLVLNNGAGGPCSSGTWSSINPGQPTFDVSSSRTIKTNLAPLEVPEILDKIARVGVYNYDFVSGPNDRIGLMAEDFHNIFGRGSDRVIQGGEVEMALWLAVQGLIEQNRELAARNDELAANHTELEARLAALEGGRRRADE